MPYYVFNPKRGKPKIKIDSYEAAEKEAIRLADKELVKIEILEIKDVVKPMGDHEINKIKSVFYPIDRLEEVVQEYGKIPRTPDEKIDYWQVAKLLCAKDGGHLPDFEESAQIVSSLYVDENGNHPKVKAQGYTDLDGYTIDVKKARALGFKNWDRTEIDEDNVGVHLWLGSEYGSYYADLRGFHTGNTSTYGYGRDTGDGQAVCLGDE